MTGNGERDRGEHDGSDPVTQAVRAAAATRRAVAQARIASRLASRSMLARWARALSWLERRGLDENGILLTFAVAVGVASAIGVVLFYRAIDLSYYVFYRWPTQALPQLPLVLYRPLLTAGALAVAHAIWRRAGSGRDGMTVPDVQLSVVRRGGRISPHRAAGRTFASAVTIGGGGSAGSEGPVAVLGATVGSALGRMFRFSAERTTVLVGAGAAAGISAAFNAPLAGAFFALEEILGSLSVSAFPPVVVASVVGAVVSRAAFGNHPAFPIPREYGYTGLVEVLVLFPLLGVLCALMSVLFVRTYFGLGGVAASFIETRPRLAAAMPWASGAIVGLLVLASRGELVGTGHLAISLQAFGRMAWWALLLLAFGKIIVTSLTLQGGGSGGLFTPSLFVGAATGGAMGVVLRTLLPTVPIAPEAFALVGMGAVVGAATGAPLTAILLVFEMTNDYAIVPPLMIAVVVCHVVARRLEPDNLYSGWLRRRGEHIALGADRDVLAGLSVADAYVHDPVIVDEGQRVSGLLQHLGNRDQGVFPVVDGERRLLGVITTADLGVVARSDHALDALVIAADLAQPTETVAPEDSLLNAVRLMGVRGVSALPVVDASTERLVGVVHRGGVLAVYERAVASGLANPGKTRRH